MSDRDNLQTIGKDLLATVIQSIEKRLWEEHGTLDVNLMTLSESCAQTHVVLDWLSGLRAVQTAMEEEAGPPVGPPMAGTDPDVDRAVDLASDHEEDVAGSAEVTEAGFVDREDIRVAGDGDAPVLASMRGTISALIDDGSVHVRVVKEWADRLEREQARSPGPPDPLPDGLGPASEAEAAEHLMTCDRKPGERIRCARCGGLFHATDAIAQNKWATGPLHGNLDRCREEMGPVQWERYTTANRGTGGPGDIDDREDGDCHFWCQNPDKDHDGPCEARNRVLPRKK